MCPPWTTSSGKFIRMWDNGLNIDLSSKQLCADNSAWKYLHIYSKSSGTQSDKWRLRLLLCLVVSGCAIIVTTCRYAASQERGIRVRWDSKRVLNCLCQSELHCGLSKPNSSREIKYCRTQSSCSPSMSNTLCKFTQISIAASKDVHVHGWLCGAVAVRRLPTSVPQLPSSLYFCCC